MPSSQYRQISRIIDLVSALRPMSVLDIGMGFGKYGLLLREYLDINDGRQSYTEWRRQIDGIEVWEKYLTPVHRYVYSNIHVGEATEILPNLGSYDLILAIDVLEHFEKLKGFEFIQLCLRKGRGLLISTPRVSYPQEAVFGNEHERHLSRWSREDFKGLGDTAFCDESISLICYIGEQASTVRRRLMLNSPLWVMAARSMHHLGKMVRKDLP